MHSLIRRNSELRVDWDRFIALGWNLRVTQVKKTSFAAFADRALRNKDSITVNLLD